MWAGVPGAEDAAYPDMRPEAESCPYGAAGGWVLGYVGSAMKGGGGGSSALSMFFFLRRRRKTATKMAKAMRAMPPRIPPTMAPTGVEGESEATGSVEEVVALERSESTVVAAVGGSVVAEAGSSDVTSAVVSDVVSDVASVDDDSEVAVVDDFLVVVVEVDFLVVEVVLGSTVDMLLLLSRLLVVAASRADVCFLALQ
jgi:hypothetical protein